MSYIKKEDLDKKIKILNAVLEEYFNSKKLFEIGDYVSFKDYCYCGGSGQDFNGIVIRVDTNYNEGICCGYRYAVSLKYKGTNTETIGNLQDTDLTLIEQNKL